MLVVPPADIPLTHNHRQHVHDPSSRAMHPPSREGGCVVCEKAPPGGSGSCGSPQIGTPHAAPALCDSSLDQFRGRHCGRGRVSGMSAGNWAAWISSFRAADGMKEGGRGEGRVWALDSLKQKSENNRGMDRRTMGLHLSTLPPCLPPCLPASFPWLLQHSTLSAQCMPSGPAVRPHW